MRLMQGQAKGADYVNHPVSAPMSAYNAGEDWQIAVMDQDLNSFAADPKALKEVSLPTATQWIISP